MTTSGIFNTELFSPEFMATVFLVKTDWVHVRMKGTKSTNII